MTAQPTEAPTLFPPDLASRAVELLRAICPAAGDTTRVLEAARAHFATEDGDPVSVAAIALLIAFGECVPGPVSLPELDGEATP